MDLFVIHPPSNLSGAANRGTLLPRLKKIEGRWVRATEPVVISAYSKGEPPDAVPLDQCMLQKGESDFRLFVPESLEYEIRVFNEKGQVKSAGAHLIITK